MCQYANGCAVCRTVIGILAYWHMIHFRPELSLLRIAIILDNASSFLGIYSTRVCLQENWCKSNK